MPEGDSCAATRARSAIHESVRCGAAGKVDKALECGLEAYREEGATGTRLSDPTDSVGNWPAKRLVWERDI